MLSRRHLAIVGAIVTLGMPGEGRAQVDTQVWANLKLDWIRSHHVTIVVDAEPKVLVSAPDGDPGWATIDVTPSIEYARGEWFDIVGEMLVGWTQQTDDLNSTELTPLPVGSGSVSSGYADPLARFAWGVSASDRVGLSGTADLGAAREVDGRVRAKPAASASLGTTVVGTLNGFVGIVAESPPIGSRPDVWSIKAGFVLPLGARTQIDVWGSRRVAGGPDDWLVGAGFVRRLR